jgi:hypothetical protein
MPLLRPSILPVALCVLSLSACSSDTGRPSGGGGGGGGSDASASADAAPADDAASQDSGGPADLGTAIDAGEAMDTGSPIDAGLPPDTGAFDAGLEDVGGPGVDVGLGFDAGFPGFDGGGFPDFGLNFDGSFPDLGLSFDGSFPGFDAGAVQTSVSVIPGTASLYLDLMPPVDPDPVRFSVELRYENVGPSDELITVTSARVTALSASVGLFQQTFMMRPDHLAPVGTSSKTISKTPGSGSVGLPNPQTWCSAPPQGVVRLELSNGRSVFELVPIQCVQ